MSDYATVVTREDLKRGPLLKKQGGKPYWVTQSWNGKHCYISWSGTDEIAKISYRTGRIVDRAPRRRPPAADPQRLRRPAPRRRAAQPGDLPPYEPVPPIIGP